MTESKKSTDKKFGPQVALEDISRNISSPAVAIAPKPLVIAQVRKDARLLCVSTKTFDISTLLLNLSAQIRSVNGGTFDLAMGNRRSYAGARDSMLSSMDPGRELTIIASQSFDIIYRYHKSFGYIDVQIGTSEIDGTVTNYEGFKLAINSPFIIKKSHFNERIGEVDVGFISDRPLRMKYVAFGDHSAFTKSYVRTLIGSRQINLNSAIPIQTLLRPEYAKKEVTVCETRDYFFAKPARLKPF